MKDLALRAEEIRDARDFQRMIDTHEWMLVNCEPYDMGGIISTMRCSRCGAEQSSAFIP